VDIRAKTGTPIYAVQDGVVVEAPQSVCRRKTRENPHGFSTGGNYIQIKTTEGYFVRFLHMDMPTKLRQGDKVTKGQILGYVGNTGSSEAPHLHWEIGSAFLGSRGTTKYNPADFYPKEWIRFSETSFPQTHRRGSKSVHTPRKA
jgi:murein DD-endopeptidase MepM/ murein hydrolase activator NlpD